MQFAESCGPQPRRAEARVYIITMYYILKNGIFYFGRQRRPSKIIFFFPEEKMA